jgi:hypothetical protein
MASQTIDLAFNQTGQSLYFDAPEGRASSVTGSTVYENTTGDDGTAESATTGSATVETNPNTTFDAASGAGQTNPRLCRISATTGVAVGRTYLATNATGEKDWVEAEAFTSADSVVARVPLVNAYTTADTFVSTRITHAIDATWVADKNNISPAFDPNPAYRWRLVYVVASVTYTHDVYFDLLRYPGRHDVSPLDVDRAARGWIERVSTDDREDQGRSVIDEAHRIVKLDLYNYSMPDQAIRNREVLNELVIRKAIELVDTTEANEKKYGDRLAQFIAWGKTSTSKDTTGAATSGVLAPLWRR